MKIKKALVVYMKTKSKNSLDCQEMVKKALTDHKIKFEFVERTEVTSKDFKGIDLAFSVGGDGTFLTTSHFITDETPVFGVNSHSETKEGFLCESSRQKFPEHFKRLLAGDFELEKRVRLICTLDGKEIMPAMNDIFIGHRKPYMTSQYFLELNGHRELHKGSGIVVSTPIGSHAWVCSAGGAKMPLHSEHFQYRARDLYYGRHTNPRLIGGVLDKSETITVISDKHDNIVVVDSLSEEYDFEIGSVLEITASYKKGLNFIVFR